MYCPTTLACLIGMSKFGSRRPFFVPAVIASIAVFAAFVVPISIFKGDPAWGPRYLTPVFALLWMFAPVAASRSGRTATAVLLAAGFAVQSGALSVDPHRLYVERGLPSAFGAAWPILYFDPANAHTLERPREIAEVWQDRNRPGLTFSPAATPTSAFPVIDEVERGRAAIEKYKLVDAFRTWWVSQRYLSPAQRPVSIGSALTFFTALGGLGLALIWSAGRGDHFR